MLSKEQVLARHKLRQQAKEKPVLSIYTNSERARGIPAVEQAIKTMEHERMDEPEIREELQEEGVPEQVIDKTYDERQRQLFKRTNKDDDVEIKEGGK